MVQSLSMVAMRCFLRGRWTGWLGEYGPSDRFSGMQPITSRYQRKAIGAWANEVRDEELKREGGQRTLFRGNVDKHSVLAISYLAPKICSPTMFLDWFCPMDVPFH